MSNSEKKKKESPRRPLEDAVIARRKQREENAARGKEGLEALKSQGNELFKKGNYSGAADIYIQAVEKYGRKAVLLSNLSITLSKLELWEQTEQVATLALQADPKNIKARFRRAVARKNMRNYQASMTDLAVIIGRDPTFIDAAEEYHRVESLFDHDRGYELEDPNITAADWAWPEPEDKPDDFASDSDTNDCLHAGNGFPCRFYNHGGCKRGESCTYSHAPDGKSVRDELGKNVCLRFLIDKCKYGDKCIYSHDKTYLPSPAWWESPLQGIHTLETLKFVENGVSGMHGYHMILRDLRMTLPDGRFVNVEKEFIIKQLKEVNALASKAGVKKNTASQSNKPSTSSAPTANKVDTKANPANQAKPPTTSAIPSQPTSNGFILLISLEHESLYAITHAHLNAALRAKHKITQTEDHQQALELLDSPDLIAVLVTDSGIVRKQHNALADKLIKYVKNGGTAVLAAAFCSRINGKDFVKFFKAWGLPWEFGSYHRAMFKVVPTNEVVQRNPSLHAAYSMKALHASGIEPEMAIYREDRGEAGEAAAVTAKVGKGYMSYLGDSNGEEESTNTILAMLGVLDEPHPGARSSSAQPAGPAKGSSERVEGVGYAVAVDSSPERVERVGYAVAVDSSSEGVERVGYAVAVDPSPSSPVEPYFRIARPSSQAQSTTNSQRSLSQSSKKMFVILTLEPHWDGIVKSMLRLQIAALESKGLDVRVLDNPIAISNLLGSPPHKQNLVGVYVANAVITKDEHRDILRKLATYVKEEGGKVVFGGIFPSDVTSDDVKNTFETFGLGWRMSSSSRKDFELQHLSELERKNGSSLPSVYSMKAVRLREVDFQEACYIPKGLYEDEHDDDDYWSPNHRGNADDIFEVAVARSRVGKGIVGYIGDINMEEESTAVLLALFDLLNPPTAPVRKSRKFVLVIPGEKWVEDIYAPLFDFLKTRIEVIHRQISLERMADLVSSPDLVGVLVASSAVLNEEYNYLLSMVVNTVKEEGRKIIFLGTFASTIKMTECRPFFMDFFDLDWSVGLLGSYLVEGGVQLNAKNPLVHLSHSSNGNNKNKSSDPEPKIFLPSTRDLDNCFSLRFTEPNHAVYVPKKVAKNPNGASINGYWEPKKGTYTAPILYAPVGKGHVGFLGGADRQDEEGRELVLSMLAGGLKDALR